MRLVSYEVDGSDQVGAVHGERGDRVLNLSAALPDSAPDFLTFIRHGPAGLAAARELLAAAPEGSGESLDSLLLRPLISNPGKIICLGLNYADHAAEGGHSRPAYPSFFLRSGSSLVAHGQAIRRPQCSEQLDFEAELVAIIGVRGRHVRVDQALAHVAGYSCFNDASVRDYQRKTTQWTIGKNFDCTGAFGPAFVTADELPSGAAGLRITSRLNGEVMQDANTSDMLFPVAETIALLSECMTLEVGDVLVMGTPSGVGHARKPPIWMKDGDVIEIEIERVGLLRNPVLNEEAEPS